MKNQFPEEIAEKWIEALMKIFEEKYDVNISYKLIKNNNEEK